MLKLRITRESRSLPGISAKTGSDKALLAIVALNRAEGRELTQTLALRDIEGL